MALHLYGQGKIEEAIEAISRSIEEATDAGLMGCSLSPSPLDNALTALRVRLLCEVKQGGAVANKGAA